MKRIAILTIILVAAAFAAHADIVADISAQIPGQPHSYAEMMAAMQSLHGTGRVNCESIGLTRGGRHIPMAVICDPAYDPRQLRKLLVFARQHGNEPAGTEAAMALMKHFATSEGAAEMALLRRVALLIVPMTNPDGASASKRGNGAGVDLNRDWVARTQPETQAIERVFRDWQADAVIDLHELPAASSRSSYQENFMETIASHGALPAVLGQRCGQTSAQVSIWMRRYGIPLNCYYDTPGDDTRLAHRHFGLDHKVPSFLFESKTGRGRSLRDRATYHILGTLVIANQLAYHYGEPALPPMQVAAAPETPAEAAPAPEPEVTSVALGDPVPDTERDGRTLLWADVTGPQDFAYLTFEMDGQVLVLTNQQPYEYSLDRTICREGPVQIAVRAWDESGRCIAADTKTVTLVQAGTLGQ